MAGDTLSASLEDYLEAIFHIVAEKQAARVKDIAARLSVNNSSVTGALHALAERGLINYAPYDIITLTEEGRREGREIVRRHEALHDFFVKVLDIEPAEAEEAACRVEHAISRGILDRFVAFLDFIEVCPVMAAHGSEGSGFPCTEGPSHEACARCVRTCLASLEEGLESSGGASEERIFLDGLEAGRKARVVAMGRRSRAVERYRETGLAPGALLEVERAEESGDAVEIKVNGYHVAIQRRDAAEITVAPF